MPKSQQQMMLENDLSNTERIAKQVFGPEARCKLPDRVSGIYIGPIVLQDSNFYLQQITPRTYVAHSTDSIEQPLLNGQHCSIAYTKNGPNVNIRNKATRETERTR